MKKYFLEGIRFLVNSNIWIALATVCFYELSLLQIGIGLQLNATIFVLFFSTLFIYNFFRIIDAEKGNKQWYFKHYNYTKSLCILAFVGSTISLFYFEKKFLPILVFAGILTILYVGPLTKKINKKYNLRKFWFLKSILVSLVWVLLTVVLPLVENNFLGNQFLFYSFEKFFFILGITIPYDIKDIREDTSDGVNTFPIKFGIAKTKWISIFFLFVGLLFAFFTKQYFLKTVIFVNLITMFLILNLKELKDELWYTFLVDGTIIFYFFTVWLLS